MNFNHQEHIERVTNFYNIEDKQSQIKNYLSTYREKLKGRFYNLQDDNDYYIGEPKGHLGDNLYYTPIPRLIKEQYPQKNIIVYPNFYAPFLFAANPYVSGVNEIKGKHPWGSHTEMGPGHAMQRRLLSHNLIPEETKGELYVDSTKAEFFAKQIKAKAAGKKVIMIHSTGKTSGSPMNKKAWKSLVALIKDDYYIVQLGGKSDRKIRNCHEHYLYKNKIENFFLLLSVCDIFIGTNSGLMHIAAALNKFSIILIHEQKAAGLVLPVFSDNEFLPNKVDNHLFHLYPQNIHLHVSEDDNVLCPKLNEKNLKLALERKIFHWPSAKLSEYL